MNEYAIVKTIHVISSTLLFGTGIGSAFYMFFASRARDPLYLFAGACWLPVVWMQLRMRRMAQEAVAAGAPLPDRYWRYFRVWVALGVPAFVSLAAVFWLMVAKPT